MFWTAKSVSGQSADFHEEERFRYELGKLGQGKTLSGATDQWETTSPRSGYADSSTQAWCVPSRLWQRFFYPWNVLYAQGISGALFELTLVMRKAWFYWSC